MKNLLFVLFIVYSLTVFSQNERVFFIGFKQKPKLSEALNRPTDYLSERSIQRRQRQHIKFTDEDLPPARAYIDSIAAFGYEVVGISKWMNGILITVSKSDDLKSIAGLKFVDEVVFLGPNSRFKADQEAPQESVEEGISELEKNFSSTPVNKDSVYAGASQRQLNLIGVTDLIRNENWGRGALIAVLDAGYKNLNHLTPFKDVIQQGRIKATYDFVDRERDVYDDDEHGLAVMSCLAAYDAGNLIGSAPYADYLLLRTENAGSETLIEEYLWVIAAEYADSAGADVINSSLGYTKLDYSQMGHKFKELDGNTTPVSIGAEKAASKGMLVFVSAGNEGDNLWRQISAPADAESVIAVGATDKDGDYVGFSSIGPSADKRMKPDFGSMGSGAAILSPSGKVYRGNGTSYACPILAGASAGLVAKYPDIQLNELKKLLQLSASQYFEKDKYLGYGVPNIGIVNRLLGLQQDTIIIVNNNTKTVDLILGIKQKARLQYMYESTQHTSVSKDKLDFLPGIYRIKESKKSELAKNGKYVITLQLLEDSKEIRQELP